MEEMRIMHYFLGFPPYRTGGLTKYAYDLMQAQADEDNIILALWPGEIKKIGGKPFIIQRGSVNGIENYELINPLPVPLDEGIKEFEAFTKSCDANVYRKFLCESNPDVIHIHTLMGLHKEFISVANELRIRTIYTSHDYFGICPKVTLYRYGECCDDDCRCKKCVQCNTPALSLKKIQIMQSPLYRLLKNKSIVKKLRKQHRRNFFANEVLTDMSNVDIEKTANKYYMLRKYYVDMYENIDFIHFNSTITEKVFKRYIVPKDSKVISITHKEIKDNRRNGHVLSNKLRILCLAPAKPFKGFNVLKAALDELWNDGKRDLELRIYSPVQNPSPYMIVREEGYNYSELPDIFANSDVLAAPSIWYETFGFTVLEAISYGVPVIVSDHVGAKDVIGNAGVIINAGNVEALKGSILAMTYEKINSYKQQASCVTLKTWNEFVKENYSIYGKDK